MSAFTVKGEFVAWVMAELYLAPLKNARTLLRPDGAAGAW